MATIASPVITPVTFSGTVSKRKSADTELQKTLESILAGEVRVDVAIGASRRNRQSTNDLPILRAGVTFLETSGSFESADAFLRTIATITFPAEGLSIVHDGFASIDRHITTNEGELAPEKWNEYQISSLRYAIHRTNFDGKSISLEYILPILLKIARVNNHSSINSECFSHISDLFSSLNNVSVAQSRQIVETWPFFAASLRPTWKSPNTLLTEELAKQAYELLDKNTLNPYAASKKEQLFDNFSLSWMTPEAATEQIKLEKVSADRFMEFSGARAEDFFLMVSHIKEHPHSECDISLFPCFAKYAANTDAVKPLFQDGFKMDWHSVYVSNRLAYMRSIADAQPTAEAGRELLHNALQASFAEVTGSIDESVRQKFIFQFLESAVDTVGTSIYGRPMHGPFKITADPAFINGLLYSVDMVNMLNQESRNRIDGFVRECLEYSRSTPEAIQAIRIGLIDSGATHLGSLRRKDLTADMLGSTLTKHPERLAEVKNLSDFMRLSRLFNIPVNVPPEAIEAASMAKTMTDAIAAASPLAGADPLAPVECKVANRRKARP